MNSSIDIRIRNKISLPRSLNPMKTLWNFFFFKNLQIQTHSNTSSCGFISQVTREPRAKLESVSINSVNITLTLLSAFLSKKSLGFYVFNSAKHTHTRLHSSQKQFFPDHVGLRLQNISREKTAYLNFYPQVTFTAQAVIWALTVAEWIQFQPP